MNSKAQAAAEEFQRDDNRPKIGPKNSFLAGVEWLKKELLEGAEPIELEVVHSRDDLYAVITEQAMKIQALREENAQDQFTIQHLRSELSEWNDELNKADARVIELEAEISRLKEYEFMYKDLCK